MFCSFSLPQILKCNIYSKDHRISFDQLKEMLVALCYLTLVELNNNAHLHPATLRNVLVRLPVSMSCRRGLPLAVLSISVILTLQLNKTTIRFNVYPMNARGRHSNKICTFS